MKAPTQTRKRDRLPPRTYCAVLWRNLSRPSRRDTYRDYIRQYRDDVAKKGTAKANWSFAGAAALQFWQALPDPLRKLVIAALIKIMLGAKH